MVHSNTDPWLQPAREVAGGFIALVFAVMSLITFSVNPFTGIGAIFMGTAFVPRIRKIGSVPINVWMRIGVFVFGFLLTGQGGTSETVPRVQEMPSMTQIAPSPSSTTESPKVEQFQTEENTAKQPINDGNLLVTDVTDGDTVKVRMSDGVIEAVRIIGIDTPETRPTECFGMEATERMRTFVEAKTVVLERDPADDRDNFGRLLRYISVDGTDVGAAMIRDGYAHSYKKYPHPRLDEYNALERDARDTYRGLWGDVCVVPEVQGESSQKAGQEDDLSSLPAPSAGVGGGQTNPFPDQLPPPEEQECVIKGNVNSKKEKIYHYPGCGSYNRTKIKPEEGDRWFCTEKEASEAGFRRAGNC
jgi:micrococcal nuclease